jgi:hypothetical protein
MKSTKLLYGMLVMAALAASTLSTTAAPAGTSTAFTYQGSLSASGQPANGLYDFRFAIWDASTGGNTVGGPLTNNGVNVTGGLFTVVLDFGVSAFPGQARWLEIGVYTHGSADFQTLAPRQPITPMPYAILAFRATLASAASGVANDSVFASGIASGQVVKSLNGLHDEVVLSAGPNVTLTTNGNALTLAAAGGGAAGGWSTTGNAGTDVATNFLGTIDNQPLEIRVNGLRAGLVVPAEGAPNVILGAAANSIASGTPGSSILGGTNNAIQATAGYSLIGGGEGNQIQPYAFSSSISGGSENQIQTNAFYSVIGGGYKNQIQPNAVYSAIGGGYYNQIQTRADHTFIGGGEQNLIQQESDHGFIGGGYHNQIQPYAWYSAIAGGWQNQIQTNASYAAIGGGEQNLIQQGSAHGFIGGGYGNVVSGEFGMVPGGDLNSASVNSFAAGHRAKALYDGCFVWGDSIGGDFASTGQNQFLIRASGGVGIGTNDPGGAALNVAGVARATTFQGDGSGLTGLSADYLDGWHGNHYWQLGGNSGAGLGENFLGTTDNNPLDLGVYGRRALRLEPTPDANGYYFGTTDNNRLDLGVNGRRALRLEPTLDADGTYSNMVNIVGGSPVNSIAPGIHGSVICGGGQDNWDNGAIPRPPNGPLWWPEFLANSVNSDLCFIGGGEDNSIKGNAGHSFLGGGWANSIEAGADSSFLGGGLGNYISGRYSVVPGGYYNHAEGKNSFAAGSRAKALHDGSFVWADWNEFDLIDWATNQFMARATGGYWLFSAIDGQGIPTAGVALAPGSSGWNAWSDRASKTNCLPVGSCAVLEAVAALPIATWNYKTQDPSIRHIGPMAQDFHAAFGVGESDKMINTIDADGVALAAIQGLNQKLEAELQRRDAENAALKRQNDSLAERLNELEQTVKTLAEGN